MRALTYLSPSSPPAARLPPAPCFATRRSLAYEISVNQRMPTIESLTHSNLLIQHYDDNLKQVRQPAREQRAVEEQWKALL